jgi:hypothetical protein
MAVVALCVLLLGSFGGLLIGSLKGAFPLAAAVPAATIVAGAEAGALCALGLAGFVAGLHLHRVVAEQYVPR